MPLNALQENNNKLLINYGNKVVLILLVLAGNIYIITRSHKSYSIIEYGNDWVILD